MEENYKPLIRFLHFDSTHISHASLPSDKEHRIHVSDKADKKVKKTIYSPRYLSGLATKKFKESL